MATERILGFELKILYWRRDVAADEMMEFVMAVLSKGNRWAHLSYMA